MPFTPISIFEKLKTSRQVYKEYRYPLNYSFKEGRLLGGAQIRRKTSWKVDKNLILKNRRIFKIESCSQ